MPKISYVDINFSSRTLKTIEQANAIISEYGRQGFDLTLRQLYYQFVARGLTPNKQTEYKRLGSIVNDGRLAGLIDWNSITDRTRNLADLAHWSSPESIIDAVARQYRIDKWATQERRIEVWIEKEALAGVFQRICQELDVPYFSCRGYTSQSEMWAAAQRLRSWQQAGQRVTILHFGDHDPSGIDMSRDIDDRLRLFEVYDLDFRRLALNWDQVQQYNPPPNPAKETDSRHDGYVRKYGHESWELDALDPTILAGLVRNEVELLRNETVWENAVADESEQRGLLEETSFRWKDVVSFLQD